MRSARCLTGMGVTTGRSVMLPDVAEISPGSPVRTWLGSPNTTYRSAARGSGATEPLPGTDVAVRRAQASAPRSAVLFDPAPRLSRQRGVSSACCRTGPVNSCAWSLRDQGDGGVLLEHGRAADVPAEHRDRSMARLVRDRSLRAAFLRGRRHEPEPKGVPRDLGRIEAGLLGSTLHHPRHGQPVGALRLHVAVPVDGAEERPGGDRGCR